MPEHESPFSEHAAEGRQHQEVPIQVDEAPPAAEPIAKEDARQVSWSRHHLVLATGAVFVLLLALLTMTGRIDSLAQTLLRHLTSTQPAIAVGERLSGATEGEANVLTFKGLDIHPDILFQPYTAGPVLGDGTDGSKQIREFRDLIALYSQRQGVDDNFTIRVVDRRTDKLLELYTLEQEREKFLETGRVHWHSIDQLRRQETRRLVDKWAARGIPRESITVKWGRADQIREARRAEAPTIEYEIRLARFLGLSLLPTEIGTVETFNQDRLVSGVGARSRYQMMPSVLRSHGVARYDLRTASGNVIPVYEEWNPLLTMEPAFTTLRGYINAVGHELPGISAYHTGPANIYKVYQHFLTHNSQTLNESTNVMDAYVWAVTEGFPIVNEATSFGNYSRGYVASAYGALKAVEEVPIDTSATMLAERVEVRDGEQMFLSQLLRTLEKQRDQLALDNYGDASLYRIFREMNPHISLPAPTDSFSVPVRGDISLVATSGSANVTFFLPLGSSQVLGEAGVDLLDEKDTFVYDHDTYGDARYGEKTMWDREYDELVRDIGQFGFTNRNRARLIALRHRFERMAEENPSHYRRMQLEIINIHENVWRWGQWEDVAAAVRAAQGKLRPEAEPPSELPATSPELQPSLVTP